MDQFARSSWAYICNWFGGVIPYLASSCVLSIAIAGAIAFAIHLEFSAHQPLLCANFANMGARAVYPISWRGAVAGLALAICSGGLRNSARIE